MGRLGQYIVGDPDAGHRLTDKLKSITTRNSPKRNEAKVHHRTTGSYDYSQILKRPSRKPNTLEPLNDALAELSNQSVAYNTKSQFGSLAKNQSIFLNKRGSQMITKTMQAVMPSASGPGMGV